MVNRLYLLQSPKCTRQWAVRSEDLNGQAMSTAANQPLWESFIQKIYDLENEKVDQHVEMNNLSDSAHSTVYTNVCYLIGGTVVKIRES
ncbi:hypothetical protein HZH68_002804 [Vespula germanica]|uniref:Uncharacterized protein n=1 Tax=Vespula germanica TaxID=30212 RepID=A0A834U1E0_VESGE|nr:hypothetical protein HZH68_002804 [Vespula germanica]